MIQREVLVSTMLASDRDQLARYNYSSKQK